MRFPGSNSALFLAALALAGCISSNTAPSPPEVPEAPATVFLEEVVISKDRAQRETSLAINPANPAEMFACTPAGVPAFNNQQSFFFHTANNGTKWTYVDVKTQQTDTRNFVYEGGDCDVGYDEGGTMYAADIWLGSVSVGASKDKGKTWMGTAVGGTSPGADRPWLVGGPAGTLHMTYQDLQCCTPSAIWYTRSTDYAATFQPAVSVFHATPEKPYTWTGNLVVAPGGKDLYSIYTNRAENGLTGNLEDLGPEDVGIAISHDAGATWTTKLISARESAASFLYPSLAMDKGGMLHAVFAQNNPDGHPVFYTMSNDKGATWVQPVPLTEGIVAYSPWVAAGEAGRAYVQWFGSPDAEATPTGEYDWYTYWAKITDPGTDQYNVTWGTTTEKPFYTGRVPGNNAPEFNMVRLDPSGLMRLGLSIPEGEGQNASWKIVYQAEAGPAEAPTS